VVAAGVLKPSALTSAVSVQATLWQGDPGNSALSAETNSAFRGSTEQDSYVTGSHFRRKDLRWPETIAIPAATALTWVAFDTQVGVFNLTRGLIIRPQTGTITKPSGWRIEARFPIRWTRELTN
jgi:hypothetical protein